MNISKHRMRLRQLINEQLKLLNIFMDRKPLLKGGIYKTKTKCGNRGCRCEREGELHTVWRFYRSNEGKTEIKTIKLAEIIRYERQTKNYQNFRQARARLVKNHREQIRIIGLLEEGLREDKVK